MNEQTFRGILHTSVSRREFLAGVGGLTFSFALGGGLLGRPSEGLAADAGVKINAWVSIGTDDVVTITAWQRSPKTASRRKSGPACNPMRSQRCSPPAF